MGLKKNPDERITLEEISEHSFITNRGKYSWADIVHVQVDDPEAKKEQNMKVLCSREPTHHVHEQLTLELGRGRSDSLESSYSELLLEEIKLVREMELEQMTKEELIKVVLELEAKLLYTDTAE